MNVHNYLLCQHVWVPLKLLMQLNHQSTLREERFQQSVAASQHKQLPSFSLQREHNDAEMNS